MFLESKAAPKKAEAALLRLVLPDFLLLFLFLSVFVNGGLIASGLVQFPLVLLLVPAVLLLSVLASIMRFYGFIMNVVRATGSLSLIYEELGGGTAAVTVDFPKPLLLFGSLASKQFVESPAKQYSFSMKADSAKYRSEAGITVDKAGYTLDLGVTDWRGQKHSRSARGKMPKLQGAVVQAVYDIRAEVLESKGVAVAQIVTDKEAYTPAAQQAKAMVAATAPPSPRRPAPPPKPLELPKTLEPKAVEAKTVEVKAELGKATKKSEKESLQDILYQLEEIDKVMKSG